MGVKFSEIERVSRRRLVIDNGKPFWEEHILSGEINFNNIDEDLVKSIKENILDKLNGSIDDEELAYLLIPYLTDIEDDIDLERFKALNRSKNEIILTLVDGILDVFSSMIDYASKAEQLQDKAKVVEGRLPQVDIKELQRQELNDLYGKFAIVTDSKERDRLIKRVIELKNELGE